MKRRRRPSKRQRQAEIILNLAHELRDRDSLTPYGLALECATAGVALGLPEAEAICDHVNKRRR
jgi:hypothetical protein